MKILKETSQNLIDNTLVFVIEQFGNYVIESIFQLKNVNNSNI